MKLLCGQVIKDILGENMDVSNLEMSVKRQKFNFFAVTIVLCKHSHNFSVNILLEFQYAKVYKLTSDAKFGEYKVYFLVFFMLLII